MTKKELAQLRRALEVPPALARLLTTLPLVGVSLRLSKKADRSGLGGGLEWMTGEGMAKEATDFYPGIAARRIGYVPVADCMFASGDPYFYRTSDGAVVRIPHDAVRWAQDDPTKEWIDESAVELVARSVEELVDRARVDAA